MATNIDVVNQALLAAGARDQIISFTEGSVSAITANTLYQPTFETLARTAQWNCLRFQAPLTMLKAAKGTPENVSGTVLPIPPQPWLYEYLLPNDCLQVRQLLPTFSVTSSIPIFSTSSSVGRARAQRREIDFAVATDYVNGSLAKVILTNLDTAQIVYTINQSNPSFWDADFQAAYVAMLAALLIPPLNLNMGLLNIQNKLAQDIIEMAKSRDANEGVVSQSRDASWITARGCGREWLSDSQGYGDYGDYY